MRGDSESVEAHNLSQGGSTPPPAPISQKDWDRVWLLRYNAYWLKTKNHFKASEAAHRDMLKFSGPRPEEPPRPGLLSGIVKTGLLIRKVPTMTKPSATAVAAAIAAAATAFGAAYTLANADGVIAFTEWITIAVAVIPAFLTGLFQSPSKNQ